MKYKQYNNIQIGSYVLTTFLYYNINACCIMNNLSLFYLKRFFIYKLVLNKYLILGTVVKVLIVICQFLFNIKVFKYLS